MHSDLVQRRSSLSIQLQIKGQLKKTIRKPVEQNTVFKVLESLASGISAVVSPLNWLFITKVFCCFKNTLSHCYLSFRFFSLNPRTYPLLISICRNLPSMISNVSSVQICLTFVNGE